MTVLRSLTTVALFLLFVSLAVRAYGRYRREEFRQAALLPFDTSEELEQSGAGLGQEMR